MRLFVEWRNALGCQLALEYVPDDKDAAQVLRDILLVAGGGVVQAGDTFHVLESERDDAGRSKMERDLEDADHEARIHREGR